MVLDGYLQHNAASDLAKGGYCNQVKTTLIILIVTLFIYLSIDLCSSVTLA